MIERGNRVIGAVFCGILSGMNNVPPSMSSKGQLPGEILVPGFALIGTMPVMKSR